jgi:hypothetical protein
MRAIRLALTSLFACGLLLSVGGCDEDHGPTSKKNDVKQEEIDKAKGQTPKAS